MTQSVLKQRSDLRTSILELTDNGVRVRIKSPGASNEFLIPYHVLAAHHVSQSTPHQWPKAAGMLLLLAGGLLFGMLAAMRDSVPLVIKFYVPMAIALVAIFVLLEVMLLYIYFFRQKNIIAFANGDAQLVMLKNKPNSAAVEKFLKELHQTKLNSLYRRIRKMSELDANFQSGAALANLLNGGIITEEQCEALEKQLNADSDAARIGFASIGD